MNFNLSLPHVQPLSNKGCTCGMGTFGVVDIYTSISYSCKRHC